MTISGSFPSDYNLQQTYMTSVAQTFENLEAQSSSIAVHSNSEPSNAVMAAQWAVQIPFAPPTNGSQISWFNPTTGRIEQVYYPIVSGSGNLIPYKVKPTNSGLEFIAEVVIGNTPAALDLNSLPVTYRHWLVMWSGRGTGVGATTEQVVVRLNNNATATYAWVGETMSGAAAPALLTATGQTYGYAGFAPNDGMTNTAQASAGHIWIPNVNVALTAFANRFFFSTSVGISNNARPYTKNYIKAGNFCPSTGVLSRVTLFPVTSLTFQRGSKMAIYGLR